VNSDCRSSVSGRAAGRTGTAICWFINIFIASWRLLQRGMYYIYGWRLFRHLQAEKRTSKNNNLTSPSATHVSQFAVLERKIALHAVPPSRCGNSTQTCHTSRSIGLGRNSRALACLSTLHLHCFLEYTPRKV
jgi:hypothetical protein